MLAVGDVSLRSLGRCQRARNNVAPSLKLEAVDYSQNAHTWQNFKFPHLRQPCCDIVVYDSRAWHRDVVGPSSAPQSLASVDLEWRDFVIFEVLLAIGAFSAIPLEWLSQNVIETSA
jgi:hypothetical protein